MKYGHYSDNELPKQGSFGCVTNSLGYRCPEFQPLPNGGKNVAVLGCSHTFGIGLLDDEVWVSQLEKLFNNSSLRFWNLGSPGASCDKLVRLLYACEKVIFPKIIIVCWPAFSRRERLDKEPQNLTSDHYLLASETKITDENNFLKCVFQLEKFAEYHYAKTFHCFAEDTYNLKNVNVLKEQSLKSCWPEWDSMKTSQQQNITTEVSLARDGLHYGVEHQTVFANLLYKKFGSKLK